MSKMDPTAPSAPMLEDDHLVGHHPPPPPSYDQAMSGVQMPGYPPPVHYPSLNPPASVPYPQQPGYAPPQMPVMGMQQNPPPPPQPAVASNTAVTTTVVVSVGPKPCRMRCPVCNRDIKTTTVTENQASAHLCCFLLCIFCCWLCSCIPYCMDSFKSVRHSCPNCNAHLGTYKP